MTKEQVVALLGGCEAAVLTAEAIATMPAEWQARFRALWGEFMTDTSQGAGLPRNCMILELDRGVEEYERLGNIIDAALAQDAASQEQFRKLAAWPGTGQRH